MRYHIQDSISLTYSIHSTHCAHHINKLIRFVHLHFMAPTVPLSTLAIAHDTTLLTLNDLLGDSSPDIENDLDVLLHWLDPYYPIGKPLTEPLSRTRAAARSCLKELSAQLEFVRLWLNSIRLQFHAHFAPIVTQNAIGDILPEVASVSKYYSRQSAYLNLSKPAAELFLRGINSLFARYLLLPKVVDDLRAHLSDSSLADTSIPLATFAAVGMSDLVQTIMAEITVQRIHIHVSRMAAGTWSVPVLQNIQEWVRVELYPSFVQGCLNATDSSSSELVRISHDELIRLRTSEIYDLVVAFPTSEMALLELHSCLVFDLDYSGSQTHHRSALVDAFIEKCNLRLLHLGSNTEDVILTYSKTIKSFLLIDPTGVLLDKVARPIRRYLKTRTDLVLQLVQGMIDLNEGNKLVELARELQKNEKLAPAPIDDLTDVNWVPDPIDALPDFKKNKVSDVVEALLSIFPLTGIFVEEFTRLYGERLLQWDKYSAADIIRDVELLKLRFGANEFSTLDVMVKDIHDSDTFNLNVNLDDFVVTVLSKMYWPTVCDNLSENDYFNVPVQAKFDNYHKNFTQLRNGRGLKLIPSLGTVKLELSLKSGIRNFCVTPAQATVIEVFDDENDALSIQTVVMVTGMAEYAVSQALRFWQTQGILREVDGKYTVDE